MLAGYYEPDPATGCRAPESLYGARKMWAHLNRAGIGVARSTVARPMRVYGWRGRVRGPQVPRTTLSDPVDARPVDLVDRKFTVQAPNVLWVSDL